MKKSQIDLYKKIDDILWKDWDPIHLNAFEDWPKDEYQSYLPKVFQLKINNNSVEEIASQLHKIEIEKMGLDRDISYCLTVAKKIVEL